MAVAVISESPGWTQGAGSDAPQQFRPPPTITPSNKHPKIDSQLVAVSRAFREGGEAAAMAEALCVPKTSSVLIRWQSRITIGAMVALLFLFLNLLTSPFKSTSRLEAENAALRQQLVVLQGREWSAFHCIATKI
jgi:hypothetical protein